MKPVNSYILLSYKDPSETTKNGLYVPQGSNLNATDILISGEVLAVSEKVEGINVGDILYYNKHAITKVPECKDKVLVRKEDIYAIL